MITSSPFPMSKATRARCKAFVPFVTAIACFTPMYSAKAFSKAAIYLPDEDIQPDSNASITYSFSLPARRGSQTGIYFLPIYAFLRIKQTPQVSCVGGRVDIHSSALRSMNPVRLARRDISGIEKWRIG